MFLANENFPRPSILLLRASNIIVKSIQEDFPGIPDEEVLLLAKKENYIILTFDKEYGELIFRYQLKDPPAVIYFREKGQQPLFAGQTLLPLILAAEVEFKKAFTVIEKENMRQRFYSKSNSPDYKE